MHSLNPPTRILLGPGPSNVHPRVLRALGTPLVGHLDPVFIAMMEETKRLLRATFMTTNALTLPISATGSAGMEACLVNLLEPGDTAIIGVNGVFGTLAVGLFAQDGLTGVATGNGLFFGGGAKLLLAQLAGLAATAIYVFTVSGAAWLVLRKTMGIRVSLQEEIEGLDIGEHGNSAYPEFLIRKPAYSFAGIEGTGRVETGVNLGAGGCA